MHMPNIATKSNTLLATILLSKKIPILLFFSVPSCVECERLEFELTRFGERIPIFTCLQSNEYKANVPPAIKRCPYK